MVSLGYSGRVWCAAARSQSGAVSAKTRGENQLSAAASVTAASARSAAAVTDLVIFGRFSILQNDLRIVIGFHRVEEISQRWIVANGKDQAIEDEQAFHLDYAALLGRGNFIRHHARLDLLGRGNGFDFELGRNVEFYIVNFLGGAIEINGVKALFRLKRGGLLDFKRRSGDKHAASGGGSEIGDFGDAFDKQREFLVIPIGERGYFERGPGRQPLLDFLAQGFPESRFVRLAVQFTAVSGQLARKFHMELSGCFPAGVNFQFGSANGSGFG